MEDGRLAASETVLSGVPTMHSVILTAATWFAENASTILPAISCLGA